MAFLERDVYIVGISAGGLAKASHAVVIVIAGTELPVTACDIVDPEY